MRVLQRKKESFVLVPVPDEAQSGKLIIGFVCNDCAVQHNLICLIHRGTLHIQWGESYHLCPVCRTELRKQLTGMMPEVEALLRKHLSPPDLKVLLDWAEDECNFNQPLNRVLLGAVIDYALCRNIPVE